MSRSGDGDTSAAPPVAAVLDPRVRWTAREWDFVADGARAPSPGVIREP
ncbi:hypothetical protein OM076_02860 [Solirubrobacter ginsenosidimutans]|uniref:Uncharacterized protein n=1 Tax=Solirubrobacter ginsenosidimutans TaxID=490573 RepID=A0A9X3RYH6_9ACTN|nr:hypothetical protein [Solirubrobacter ginsenosidimutans]MDA0159194.1 hypothetical protein [Solirubrobacter ginsenosidimutans]